MSRQWKSPKWFLNKVNKSLVSMIEELGVKACGISGKDGGMLKVDKKLSGGETSAM